MAFDAVLCEALQHNLPSLSPPAHKEKTEYPLPRVIFRMFDYTDCPDDVSQKRPICISVERSVLHLQGPVLPGAHSIERFLIEQELTWIMRQHYIERKDWWEFYSI